MPYNIINFYQSQKKIIQLLHEQEKKNSLLPDLQKKLNELIGKSHRIMQQVAIKFKDRLHYVCSLNMDILHSLDELNITLKQIKLTDNEVLESTQKYLNSLNQTKQASAADILEKLCMLTDTLSTLFLLSNQHFIRGRNNDLLQTFLAQLTEIINTHLESLESSNAPYEALLTEYYVAYNTKTNKFLIQKQRLFPPLTPINIIQLLVPPLVSGPRVENTISLSSDVTGSLQTNTLTVQETLFPASSTYGSIDSLTTLLLEPSSKKAIDDTSAIQANSAQVQPTADSDPLHSTNSNFMNEVDLFLKDDLNFAFLADDLVGNNTTDLQADSAQVEPTADSAPLHSTGSNFMNEVDLFLNDDLNFAFPADDLVGNNTTGLPSPKAPKENKFLQLMDSLFPNYAMTDFAPPNQQLLPHGAKNTRDPDSIADKITTKKSPDVPIGSNKSIINKQRTQSRAKQRRPNSTFFFPESRTPSLTKTKKVEKRHADTNTNEEPFAKRPPCPPGQEHSELSDSLSAPN